MKADSRVCNEYDRLRSLRSARKEEFSFSNTKTMQDTNSVLTLSLLNIRCLRKHSSDVKCDVNLLKSDVLAFIETQLLPGDNDSDIIKNLTPFTLYRHDHDSDKFSSLALCMKNSIDRTCVYQKYFPTLNAVKFVMACGNDIKRENLSFLLVYRKNGSNILEFVNGIEYLLRAEDIDIVLGDFNINFFNSKDMEQVTLIMESFHYLQIVEKPTFISDSLLDHVYIRQANKVNICSSVISVYYSDHDAVKITVSI